MIILHEAEPIKGQRLCILMPDRPPGPTAAMEVLPVPEPFFLTYAADVPGEGLPPALQP